MTMPTYDDVKGAKASVENVKSLSIQTGKGYTVGKVETQEKKESPPISTSPQKATTTSKEKKVEKIDYIF
jgi:hypothetical protein